MRLSDGFVAHENGTVLDSDGEVVFRVVYNDPQSIATQLAIYEVFAAQHKLEVVDTDPHQSPDFDAEKIYIWKRRRYPGGVGTGGTLKLAADDADRDANLVFGVRKGGWHTFSRTIKEAVDCATTVVPPASGTAP